MATINWKRSENGGKPSKCGTYEICGGSTVGFSLWVGGWRIAMFDLQGDARAAAEALANGGRIVANWRVYSRGMAHVVRDTDIAPRGLVSLADIMAIDTDAAAA